MKIAVIGASGYIGTNLIKRLLIETNHEIIALSRNSEAMTLDNVRLKKHNIDIFDKDLASYVNDVDAIYYLIHMMEQTKMDFAEAEKKAALSFNKAIKGSRAKRIIYLGGLGSDLDNLSKHLSSRHNTGSILRQGTVQIIEFRASMIIGKGSIAYDIVVNLVHKLPVLLVPKWSETLSQPIGLDDAISYLITSLDLRNRQNLIIEIGGPEKMSYQDIIRHYSKWQGKKRLIIEIPIIPVSVSAWWLNLFTPKNQAKVGRAMAESLANEMIVTNLLSERLFPKIHPKPIDKIFI